MDVVTYTHEGTSRPSTQIICFGGGVPFPSEVRSLIDDFSDVSDGIDSTRSQLYNPFINSILTEGKAHNYEFGCSPGQGSFFVNTYNDGSSQYTATVHYFSKSVKATIEHLNGYGSPFSVKVRTTYNVAVPQLQDRNEFASQSLTTLLSFFSTIIVQLPGGSRTERVISVSGASKCDISGIKIVTSYTYDLPSHNDVELSIPTCSTVNVEKKFSHSMVSNLPSLNAPSTNYSIAYIDYNEGVIPTYVSLTASLNAVIDSYSWNSADGKVEVTYSGPYRFSTSQEGAITATTSYV